MQIACMTTTKAKQTTTATKAEPSLIDWKGAHAFESSDPRDRRRETGRGRESTINLDSQYQR